MEDVFAPTSVSETSGSVLAFSDIPPSVVFTSISTLATAESICAPMSASISATVISGTSVPPVSMSKSKLISDIVSTWTTPVFRFVELISTVATFEVSSTSTVNSISIPPPSASTISISNESTSV